MRTLLSLSVAVLVGLLMTRVAKPLKLPSVTAYLVAGVLIGPYCLGLLGIQGLPAVRAQKNRQTGLCDRCSAGAGRNVSG